MSHPPHDIVDLNLAGEGQARIAWAAQEMPVLTRVRQRFAQERPLDGIRVAACLHLTPETANLVATLQAGGAEVALCASNPFTTQNDIAASLVKNHGTRVYGRHEADSATFDSHIAESLQFRPHVFLDDGARLSTRLHGSHREVADEVIGGTEETNTGILILRQMASEQRLGFPIISIKDAETKHLFDHRYGTGQTTVDGILRATNILLCGRVVVVCGYGWCGRGVATRARGFGANVVVTEVNPIRALEATMDGYRVLPMKKAAPEGDVFITVTGDVSVIAQEHFALMRDGALVCNSGQGQVEIDIEALEAMSTLKQKVRPFVTEYTLENGNRVRLLGEGRQINLSASEGHPSSVMDMNFANQALACAYIVKSGPERLKTGIHRLPEEIDEEVARLKLESLGISIDTLTDRQLQYLTSGHLDG